MASTIYDLNAGIIQNALQTATDAVASADSAANAAIAAAAGYAAFSQAYGSWAPGASEPPVYIPTTSAEIDPILRYETERNYLTSWLSGLFANFFANYYPIASDAYDEAMAWLVNTITNGGTGIPANVENQIWQRHRDKIQTSALQAQNSAYADFSARGFSIPPGALAARLENMRIEGINKLSEASRDIAIKQVDIEIDNIKFAVKEALDARMKAIAVASDYIKTMAIAPEQSTKLASLGTESQSRLISASADFYRARLSRDELTMKAWANLMDQKGKDGSANLDTWAKSVNAKVHAAVGAANTYASVASSALQSLTNVVSISTQAFED